MSFPPYCAIFAAPSSKQNGTHTALSSASICTHTSETPANPGKTKLYCFPSATTTRRASTTPHTTPDRAIYRTNKNQTRKHARGSQKKVLSTPSRSREHTIAHKHITNELRFFDTHSSINQARIFNLRHGHAESYGRVGTCFAGLPSPSNEE